MLKQFVDKCTVKLKTTAIRRTLSVLAVTAVLIGFLFLCFGSRILPFQFEPLTSTWNDEMRYYRTTQEVLTETAGQNANGIMNKMKRVREFLRGT